jgi:hypothetical protein
VLALLSEPAEPARVLEGPELYAVFGYYCGQCHPTDADFVRGPSWDGMYMGDLNELIQTGKVTPGDGEASRLVLRMRKGDMPPISSAAPPMPDAMIERVVQFIDNLPTTGLPENYRAALTLPPPRRSLSNEQLQPQCRPPQQQRHGALLAPTTVPTYPPRTPTRCGS